MVLGGINMQWLILVVGILLGYFIGLHSKAKETHIYHKDLPIQQEEYNSSYLPHEVKNWIDLNQ